MTHTLPAFQQYQLAFTAHLRDPKAHPKPRGVPDKRLKIYRQAVYTNFFNTVSACFPVCQQVLGKRRWQALIRRFIAGHAAQTPVFREIPQAFIAFINTLEEIPATIKALAHYEWVELAVSHLPAPTLPARHLKTTTESADLIEQTPVFAPHQLLAYDYPVHQISPKFCPSTVTPTYLLVYQDQQGAVQFIALNAVTYRLLALLDTQIYTGRQALILLAEELGHDAQSILAFGKGILHELMAKQVLIGSR